MAVEPVFTEPKMEKAGNFRAAISTPRMVGTTPRRMVRAPRVLLVMFEGRPAIAPIERIGDPSYAQAIHE